MRRDPSLGRPLAALATTAAAIVLLAATVARADRLTLEDGRVLDGRILKESEAGVDFEIRRETMVTVLHVARADVRSIERGPVSAPAGAVDPAELARVARRAAAAIAKGAYLEAVDAVHGFDRGHPGATPDRSAERLAVAAAAAESGLSRALADCDLGGLAAVAASRAARKCAECGGEGTRPCPGCAGGERQPCHACAGTGAAPCTTCGGSGTRPCTACGGGGGPACGVCGGRGKIYKPGHSVAGVTWPAEWVHCNPCEGKGRLTCRGCDGRGSVRCAACKGETKRPCASCGGSGKAGQARVQLCGTCAGARRVDCPSCEDGLRAPARPPADEALSGTDPWLDRLASIEAAAVASGAAPARRDEIAEQRRALVELRCARLLGFVGEEEHARRAKAILDRK